MNEFALIFGDALREASTGESLVGMGLNPFVRHVLGARLWKKQREINDKLEYIYRNPECGIRRLFVGTGHGVGKTFDASAIVCWALSCWNPSPVVITSAPTFRQVRDQLWREIRAAWNGSRRLTTLADALTTRIELDEKHYAYGFSTNQPAKFQGIHAEQLLFVIDEANGFPEEIWESIDSCVTGGRAIVFAIGNTIVPYGRFFVGMNEGNHIMRMSISSREHPNVVTGRELIPGAVTRQWIQEFEEEYKNTPHIIRARVDAEFPDSAEDTLISRSLFKRIFTVVPKTLSPVVLGVDVARFGNNLTVVTTQTGQELKSIRSWGKKDTVETANRVRLIYEEEKPEAIVVDDDGVGGGVTDQLRSWKLPVIPFHGGGKALQSEKFADQISEAYWYLREGLERDLLGTKLKDHELELQCTTRSYEMYADKVIKLEPKKKYVKRTGLSSPDKSDSWAMAVWGVMTRWLRVAA